MTSCTDVIYTFTHAFCFSIVYVHLIPYILCLISTDCLHKYSPRQAFRHNFVCSWQFACKALLNYIFAHCFRGGFMCAHFGWPWVCNSFKQHTGQAKIFWSVFTFVGQYGFAKTRVGVHLLKRNLLYSTECHGFRQ